MNGPGSVSSETVEEGATERGARRYEREVPPETVLFQEGEPGGSVYVVREGFVRIWKAGPEGRRQLLARLGPGEFFGEMALVTGRPRSATAETETPCRLLVLEPDTFAQMLKEHADVAVRLVLRLAQRLEEADRLIEILLHRDPQARVVMALAKAAERGHRQADGSVRVAMDDVELAARLGLEAEDVVGVVRRLQRLGLLEPAEGGFVVRDPMRLNDFLEFLRSQRERGA